MKRLSVLILAVLFILTVSFSAKSANHEAVLICTEPTSNTDESPLTDLSKLTYWYRVPPSTTWLPCTEEPATQATGGGQIQHTCAPTEPVNDVVEFMARAVDAVGNESDNSSIVTRFIDNTKPKTPSCQ